MDKARYHQFKQGLLLYHKQYTVTLRILSRTRCVTHEARLSTLPRQAPRQADFRIRETAEKDRQNRHRPGVSAEALSPRGLNSPPPAADAGRRGPGEGEERRELRTNSGVARRVQSMLLSDQNEGATRHMHEVGRIQLCVCMDGLLLTTPSRLTKDKRKKRKRRGCLATWRLIGTM